jgi:hypothetical protein
VCKVGTIGEWRTFRVPEASDAVTLTRERHDDDRRAWTSQHRRPKPCTLRGQRQIVSVRNDEVELAAD